MKHVHDHSRHAARPVAFAAAIAALWLVAGCATTGAVPAPAGEPEAAAAAAILEGDTLKISFPGAQALDTVQEVRRDGRVSLPIAGEVIAAGRLPEELAADLSKLYAAELLSNEVVVAVVASAFNVNVSGAVLRPGKYSSKRPLTALEAVMEAGGFDHAKANVKRVVVVRHENGRVNTIVLDLSLALEGKPSEPFYLKPSDIVFVPTRFVWF